MSGVSMCVYIMGVKVHKTTVQFASQFWCQFGSVLCLFGTAEKKHHYQRQTNFHFI
uniref:Uncharacterized protein n=1 Tax=Anguilla anguilla TaxID=7936 RepID=A0A0E9VDI0_ANGAN